MSRCHVFLVPGFFGFAQFGELAYFRRVREVLGSALARRDVEARFVECTTQPTGSIRRRAVRLLEQVLRANTGDDDLSFVGHSTGGLDVRVLLSPGVRLGDSRQEDIARHTRSAILVSTPNKGTPLASYFVTLQGRRLLKLLALLATGNEGRHAIHLAAIALSLAARLDPRRTSLLDHLAKRALRHITSAEDNGLWEFLRQVSADQASLVQVSPDAMDLVDASLADNPGTFYGSVLTAAPPPPFAYGLPELGRLDLMGLAVIFTVLWRANALSPESVPYGAPAPLVAELGERLGFAVDESSNDGIVPLFSQLHGKILDVVRADHLDVVGQFHNAGGDPHADWMPSGSRFGEARFGQVWDRIAQAIVTGA